MDSSQVFRAAKKHLGFGKLQKIFRRSSPMVSEWAVVDGKHQCPCCGQVVHNETYPSERLMHLWAANPRHVSFRANNPLDQIRLLLDELDSAGCEDEAVWTGNYLVELLGLHCTRLQPIKSDKGTIDGEAADILEAAGKLVHKARAFYTDKTYDSRERVELDAIFRQLLSEVHQFRDAAGWKPLPEVNNENQPD